MHLDIEHEFEQAIAQIGGEPVRKIVGESPTFNNADFLFKDSRIVAELKCLDEDKILDDRIIEKASKFYLEELQTQTAPCIAFGTVRMTTRGFSEAFIEKIMSLYKKPIEGLVKKANRQIRDTVAQLGLTNAKGILIIANNNHSALDPWHGCYILNRILSQDFFSNINCAILLTANQQATLPGHPAELDVWAEIHRTKFPEIEAKFLSSLRDTWYGHLALLKQQPTFTMTKIDPEDLVRIENKQET